MRKRGFTLIELIVVMAIIAILVLLGVPKYKSYTEEARITKLIVEAKELEKASQQYYIRHNDWPRLNDTPYTADQINSFGEKILDKTVETVELDSEGNYYDINYSALTNYITNVENKLNYILQNPIGSVYIIDKVNEVGKNRIAIPVEPEEPEKIEELISVKGMLGYKIPAGSIFNTSSAYSLNTGEKIGDGSPESIGDVWIATNNNSYVDITFPTPQTINGVEILSGAITFAGNVTVTIQNYVDDSWVTVFTKILPVYTNNSVNFEMRFTETTFNKMRVSVTASNTSWVSLHEMTLVPDGSLLSDVPGMLGYKIPDGSTYYASSVYSSNIADKIGDGIISGHAWSASNNDSYVDVTFPTSQVIRGVDVHSSALSFAGDVTVIIQNYVDGIWVTVATKTLPVGTFNNVNFELRFSETAFDKIRVKIAASNSSWVCIPEMTLVP